ncbi:VWA domain-containing protein [Streptomyces sp. SCA3-4]|uniref:vWA domain-containing protein n=1 Tax=Streptomyces sichuanensis TaxID=2871810 RepID=UPI001CE37ACF|nr:vWA domain-containing protein [Streptomyces sichuanensis]MCA6094447.1 VWA domain-containing protein [Streptomyces sichuanensis]
MLLVAALPAAGGAAPGRAAGEGAADVRPIEMVVAVDESNSLGDADVERERDAAQRIAAGEISDRSRVTVLGFASADDATQHPVDEVCPTTTLDPVARNRLGDCVRKLARRTAGQGTGTDFPAVVQQAVDRLSEGPDGTPRVLFLLTDGKLDVGDSDSYGAREHRQKNGERLLTEVLAKARAAKVQIWPLGFGGRIDEAALKAMAAAGYQEACTDLPQARPQARVVPDATTLAGALRKDFAAARCLVSDDEKYGTPPADLTVRISPLATLASIVVSKGDPAVGVTYVDPLGKEVTSGEKRDGSVFERTGSGQEVESLRITDPRPGDWKVHLAAPEGHRDKLASVGVQWRGALRSFITMSPTAPRPGQRATAQLQLQTRDHEAITDPRDLEQLRVSARLTGDGFDAQPVTLADNGRDGDAKAGDGRFTGSVTLPATARGALHLVGVLSAVGLTADHRVLHSWIGGAVAQVRADVELPNGVATVHPGGTLPVTVTAVNTSATTRTLVPDLADAAPGDLTLSMPRLTLAPQQTVEQHGTLRVGGGARPRTLTASVQVTDTTGDVRVLDAKPVTVKVVPVPSLPARIWHDWWAAIVPGVIVLACLLAYAVWALRDRERRADPTGLVLRVLVPEGSGHREGGSLTVNSGGTVPYRFDVADETGDDPRLEPRPDTGRFHLRRSRRDGGVLLRAPGRAEEAVRIGSAVPLLESGALLRIERGTSGRAHSVRGALGGLGRLLGGHRRTPPPGTDAGPGRPPGTGPAPGEPHPDL